MWLCREGELSTLESVQTLNSENLSLTVEISICYQFEQFIFSLTGGEGHSYLLLASLDSVDDLHFSYAECIGSE